MAAPGRRRLEWKVPRPEIAISLTTVMATPKDFKALPPDSGRKVE
jgi:hypothetical protein